MNVQKEAASMHTFPWRWEGCRLPPGEREHFPQPRDRSDRIDWPVDRPPGFLLAVMHSTWAKLTLTDLKWELPIFFHYFQINILMKLLIIFPRVQCYESRLNGPCEMAFFVEWRFMSIQRLVPPPEDASACNDRSISRRSSSEFPAPATPSAPF